ncbi:MAG: stress response translation initiation inhibitor YciH [Planctomycetes bacterium]|jgi:translation initiation factor 1|nr:stress response translation initiation inhibitor YciH [Planctomycetota bacterium]
MGIVWDSESGQACPLCRRPVKSCRCVRTPVQPDTDGIVRLRIEKGGRKGKTVTVVTGLPVDGLRDLVKALKKRCGTGGSVKDTQVEFQGDHRDVIRAELVQRGLIVRG